MAKTVLFYARMCPNLNYISIMMSFLAYITGFFMNFELDQRTQFWNGAIQESFQQSLVDIGSVVSEEKIFFNFIPPFF
jgi:hypothetical protein